MKRALLIGVTALALAACGDAASPTAPPARHTVATHWQEPANYEYTVSSTCGERLLFGIFTLTVADGAVTGVSRADGPMPEVKPANFPTLQDLLDEYTRAVQTGAHVAKLEIDPADGHPIKIDLDQLKNAIDDEACYRVSNYTPRS